MQRALLLAAAALAGAAGLGIEVVLVSAAGLALGYGRSGALGLAAWIAGWALGAWLAGRSARGARPLLAVAGLGAALTAALAPEALFRLGEARPGGALATVGGLACIALAALPQGLFLPALARAARAARVGWLVAANLVGSVAGAWWIGHVAVAGLGRPGAGLVAAACALAAGAAGVAAARRAAGAASVQAGAPDASATLTPARAGAVAGLATAWLVGVEWICLRLALLWLDGVQVNLSAVLAASLAALALGAAVLPRCVPRGVGGLRVLLALCLLGTAWPVFAAPALRAVVGSHPFVFALVLSGPALLPFGALVPALYASVVGESGRRLGSLLLHEVWGAGLAGPLVHWLLVPRFGLGGSAAALAALALPAGLVLGARGRAGAALAACALVASVALALAPEPARATPQLVDPALVVRAFHEDSEYAVAVVDDGLLGERTLLTDRFRAASDGRDYHYMRTLAHLPLLLSPAPRRVAVLCLGTGTTVGAVSLHPEVERVDVLEISRAVAELAPWFEDANRGALREGLPGLLDDGDGEARVVLRLGDGRHTLARSPGAFDVVTIEPLLPDSPFGVYLYTPEFYAVAARALREGGLVCQWVPPHALRPESFVAVVEAFRASFPWSAAFLAGTQLVLVGGARRPELDPARWPAPDTELGAALAFLGLDDPAGLAARCVGEDVALAGAGARPLSDRDPWIVYRERPSGLQVLGWLPSNLEHLLSVGRGAPEAWRAAAAPRFEARARQLSALREGRLAQASAELELRAGALDLNGVRSRVLAALEGAEGLGQRDAEFDRLREELEFLFALREGVAGLGASGGPDRATLDRLTRAAALRPERADVHLYVALAFQRAGRDDVADAAWRRALEQCPRILETPAGRRALGLGFRAP